MTVSERKQYLEELAILEKDICSAFSILGNPLQKLDLVATYLEDSHLDLDESSLASIMLAVFKTGEEAGKKELKRRIANM